MTRRSYKCPVCDTKLSRIRYLEALGILEERDRHHEGEKEELLAQLQSARTNAKAAYGTITNLKRGTTPQTDGLEFEDQLVARLKREFPEDEVVHKGKGGDVLLNMKLQGQACGCIVYECKRAARIQTAHVRQAWRAKQTRQADFVVLVHTGSRRRFAGFCVMDRVLVVAPLGVISLTGLLRANLLELARMGLGRKQRGDVASRMLELIKGREFRHPIERTIQHATELKRMLADEERLHRSTWARRSGHYEEIAWDTEGISENIAAVLAGKPVQSQVKRSASARGQNGRARLKVVKTA